MINLPSSLFLLSFATFYSYISFHDLIRDGIFTCKTLSYLVHTGVLLYFISLKKREETLILPFVTCSSLMASFSIPHPYAFFTFLVFCETLPRLERIHTFLVYFVFVFLFYLQDIEVTSAESYMTYIFHSSFICSLSSWKVSSRLLFFFILILFCMNISFLETNPTNGILLGCSILSLIHTLLSLTSEENVFLMLDRYDIKHKDEVLHTDAETNQVLLPSVVHWISSLFHSITLFMLAFYNSVRKEKECTQYDVELISIHSASVSAFLLGMLPTLCHSRKWMKYVVSIFPITLSILLKLYHQPSSLVLVLIVSSTLTVLSLFIPYKHKVIDSNLLKRETCFFTSVHFFHVLIYVLSRSWICVTQPSIPLTLSNIFHYLVVTSGISINALLYNHSFSVYVIIISFVLLFHELFTSLLIFSWKESYSRDSYFVVTTIPIFISMSMKLLTCSFNSSEAYDRNVKGNAYANRFSVLNLY